MIELEDYLWFVDEALDGMLAVVTGLGDDLANLAPDLPGANSPYAVLTHCLGVMEYWAGHVVAGRNIERDRDAEFRASGPVADLAHRVEQARARFRVDLERFDPRAAPRGTVHRDHREGHTQVPYVRTQGGVLLHVYEELAQHHGQLEITRDVLQRGH